MKSMIKVLGVVTLVALIGLSIAACASSPAQSAASITSVTITGIPSQYDGKFVMLTLDTGGSNARDLAWGTRTISGTSATFNLLDWVTDQPTTVIEGNYGVSIVIADNIQAILDDNELYIGVILSRALSGKTVSIGFGEFISF